MCGEGVGDRVRRFRRNRGLTQQSLAALAHIDKSYVSRLEAGEIADPGVELVERLCGALGVSVRLVADPRWYAGDANQLPDWEAAILAVPPTRLTDKEKEAIISLVRTVIAAKPEPSPK